MMTCGASLSSQARSLAMLRCLMNKYLRRQSQGGGRREGGREREGAAAERPRTWIVLQYESYLCRNGYMCRNGYLYMYMCGNWFCASYCRYGVLLNYMYST